MMLGIDLKQVVKAASDIGLRVCRRSRITAKANVEDEEGKARPQSLGEEAFSTHRFNNLSVAQT